MLRSINPEEFMGINAAEAVILDIRRGSDYEDSGHIIPGAKWKDPASMDEWVGSIPVDGQVIVYCVQGGGVSNSVIDRLHAEGVNARFIEGGIEGFREAGGTVIEK